MTLVETDDIAGELTALVRSVSGVNTVYSAKPLVSQLVSATVGAVTGEPARVDLVAVAADSDKGVEVLVSIGVGSTEPAPAVCKRVFDVIHTYLRQRRENVPILVNVTVGSVG